MSYAQIRIEWVINCSDLNPDQWLFEKEIGYALNDFWCLKLYKISGGTRLNLAIERKKIFSNVDVYVHLKFSNPSTRDEINIQSIKKFGNSLKISNKIKSVFIREFFKVGNIIVINGKVDFHLIAKAESVIPPPTLSTLSTDFSRLCCDQKYSDLILMCGFEAFPAHKNILAARSPVFAEMLQNTPNDAKLSINDLDPAVLRAVLVYIYSGKMESMTCQSACDLLSAADRFCLNELKLICIDFIECSLTVENVFDYIFKFESLKSYAVQFMARNLSVIKDTKQWVDFKQGRPDLAEEILKL